MSDDTHRGRRRGGHYHANVTPTDAPVWPAVEPENDIRYTHAPLRERADTPMATADWLS